MLKKKNYSFYRRPRTTQERRINGKRNKWGRAKRNASNLVDSYDDLHVTHQKTWKVKRRTQYRENRGKEHSIFLPNDDKQSWWFWLNIWRLKDWFDDHNIPYRVEKVENSECIIRYVRNEYRLMGYTKHTNIRAVRPRNNGSKKTPTKYKAVTVHRPVFRWVTVKLDNPRKCRYVTLLGYKLTWWSDKDIGINYLLKRFSRPN